MNCTPRAVARTRAPAPAALLLALAAAASGCPSGGANGANRGAVVGAASYTSRVDTSWTPPAALGSLYTAARAGGAQAGRELAADATLAETAQRVAARVAASRDARAPAVRVIQALAWSAGLIDPLPTVVVSRVPAGAPLDGLTRSVADMAREERVNVVGIGRAELPAGDASIIVVAMAQRRVTLTSPVPRQLAAGARVRLEGQLAAGLRNPELALTHPDGRNEHFPLGDGPEFVAQFPAPARGTYQVELLAEGEGGSTVVANFPVYVDAQPPATPEDVAATSTEEPARVEPALLALINEARRAAGRRPLEAMPALAEVARTHSRDMASNRFIAHNSRTTGTPSDRLQRAGLSSGTVLENLARGYTAREIHEGLMASPGHRANILNERVTHVGVGAVADTGGAGGLLVTENFIEVGAAIDTAQAARRLLELINENRARRNVPALVERTQLVDAANQAARAYFEGTPTQQEINDRATRQVGRTSLLFRRVGAASAVVSRIEDASALEPLMARELGAVGIGVAQGNRRDAPPNAVFILFVLGYPR